MAPKYKGDSEEWLDNEGVSSKRKSGFRAKKASAARSLSLPPEEANAVVAEVFPNQCRVRLDEDQSDLLCSYRRAEVVGKAKREFRERSPVAVGDRVLVKRSDSSSGQVEGICVRQNCLSRMAPGRESEIFQHVLAANIDLLVIVASTVKPEFSPGLVDRFLVAAETEGIRPLLCVTKMDLISPSVQSAWSLYRDLGYELIEVSSKQKSGIPALFDKIKEQTVVFCGQSGVGKTSLLRALLNSDVGKVGDVSEATGKGRHTTTGAVLLGGPEESKWIDTPGIKEFGLVKIKSNQLASWFPEFKPLACSHQGCLHIHEENCDARLLPRYASYRRIFDSLPPY